MGAILAATLAMAVCATLLPDEPYQRFQLLDNTIQHNARWIYERTHFDATPVDVAFFGPSRLASAVDAPLIEADLAALDERVNVVNFATPEEGRNLNLVFAEELFATKRPKLIVIGVIEKPGRFGHPAFKYIAPAAMVANPGYFGNLSYLSDVMYLPFRQMKLFVARLFPTLSGIDDHFDPAQYLGATPAFLSTERLPDGHILDHTQVVPAEILEGERAARMVEEHPPILPQALADIEFGGDRHYVRELAHLAATHGTRVAFLFLPYFHGPHTVQEQPLYISFGPLIDASFLSDRADLFSDIAHLNRDGTTVLTNWLAPQIKQLLQGVPSAPAS